MNYRSIKNAPLKSSFKKLKPVILYPHKVLDETVLTREAMTHLIVTALIEGDMELVKEVLMVQIMVSNKSELGRKSNLGRQTLYDLIEDKREFNPTLKTLSSLLKAFAA